MSGKYQRPAPTAGGLRLHLNENTAGCSPRGARRHPAQLGARGHRVLSRLRREWCVRPRSTSACRRMATADEWPRRGDPRRRRSPSARPSRRRRRATGGLVAAPGIRHVRRLRARVRGRSWRSRRSGVRRSGGRRCSGRSRRDALVFITSPNNPTGVRVGLDDIERVAARCRTGPRVRGRGVPRLLRRHRPAARGQSTNVIVGRTFAKAHGLAALRAGCLLAPARHAGSLPLVVPPYSLERVRRRGAARRHPDRPAWLVRGPGAAVARVGLRVCERSGSRAGRAAPTSC